MRVPLHFKGAEESEAVKLGGAVVSHIANEIEITCLPADLPEFLEVDLSKIVIGQSVHAKDVVLPKGVSLVLHIEQDNPVIANARIPTVKAEPEPVAAEAAAAATPDAAAPAADKEAKDKEAKS
jgi:large subunit ribosomal protein L25